MRIAILCPVFWTFDGISRAVEDQAEEFASESPEVTIFTLATNMEPPLNVALYVLGMPKSSLGQRIYRLLFPLDFVKAVKWTPKLKGFDVLYGHQYPMTWLAYLAKRFYGIRYIYYNHGISPPDTFSNLIERAYMKMFALLANWTIKRADSCISISQYMRRQLKKETGLDSEVTYRKADVRRFRKGIDGSRVRQRYNLRNVSIILFVGRISPHKGIHLLIKAFNLVRQEIPEAKLVIVGKHMFADYSKKLKQMSDDSVIFTGSVSDEDLPYYYAACDVYATATLWEGFDLPLAEAQACGKPVVAFDIGPHPEVVKDEGAGLLAPAGDTTALADAVIRLLQGKNMMDTNA